MEPLIIILLVSVVPAVVAVTTAVTATKTNARWRERRAAREGVNPTEDVVRGRAAH